MCDETYFEALNNQDGTYSLRYTGEDPLTVRQSWYEELEVDAGDWGGTITAGVELSDEGWVTSCSEGVAEEGAKLLLEGTDLTEESIITAAGGELTASWNWVRSTQFRGKGSIRYSRLLASKATEATFDLDDARIVGVDVAEGITLAAKEANIENIRITSDAEILDDEHWLNIEVGAVSVAAWRTPGGGWDVSGITKEAIIGADSSSPIDLQVAAEIILGRAKEWAA